MSNLTFQTGASAENRAFQGKVSSAMRAQRNGHAGCVVWFTGLSGSGKTTLAAELERALFEQGKQACVLDGDILRRGLCSDLGFSPPDRNENIRRAGEVARLFADVGFICIAAFISPYQTERQMARRIAPAGRFLEIFLNAPIEVCEQRDPKGLYARARAGEIENFTGISAPYEVPEGPDLELRTDLLSIHECVTKILACIDRLN